MLLPGRHGDYRPGTVPSAAGDPAFSVCPSSAQALSLLRDTSVCMMRRANARGELPARKEAELMSSTPGTRIPWSLPPLPAPAPSASQLRGPQGWGTHPPA